MARAKLTKSDLLAQMGAHVLSHGLSTASLRPLAKAAGTSDRMLIYHFGSKDALVGELLAYLAGQLATQLTEALPQTPAQTQAAAMKEIVALLRREPFAAYMRLWLEIVAEAAQGNAVFAAIGHAMIDGYVAWLISRLPPGTHAPEDTAKTMLAFVEGMVVLDAVGHGTLADRAIAMAFPD